MKKKQTIKYIVDALMTLALLCLMAYQVMGEALHEWIGVGMTVILIVHHILNIKWYGALFKGRYNAYRVIMTVINTLLLAAIVLTAFCGMSMSSHAVPFLYGMADMIFARTAHLALSFWSFMLMGLHLGLHLPAMTAKLKPGKAVKAALTVVFTVLAGAGLWLFVKNGIPGYISFRTHFAFFDYDKAAVLVFLENLLIEFFFVFVGANIVRLIRSLNSKTQKKQEKKSPLIPVVCVLLAMILGLALNTLSANGNGGTHGWDAPQNAVDVPDNTIDAEPSGIISEDPDHDKEEQMEPSKVNDGFVLVEGGSFLMGSPESENWRIEDETQHQVSVSAFYMDPYETTQEEYKRLTGEDPSSFKGDKLPVESISWLDAIRFANAKSADAGLTPAYTISAGSVIWDRSANGYRLPTEAEWEYACRAGTITPFNTQTSISTKEANYWGSYPYEIEENYFNTSALETRPAGSEGKTAAIGTYPANAFGLYEMHGNVNEWCWDLYGAYDISVVNDPAGPASGTRHVYRGGGWNDFAKNLRSAYRAAGQSDLTYSNLGVRLVRNADPMEGVLTSPENTIKTENSGKMLIVYYSWSGNTRGIAREIQSQTGADVFEIKLVHPYSTDYNTVLMEAQEDQHRQARPEIKDLPESLNEYDVILLGYPNWWASIPMPIATFLESYDFSGKTIIPFCSHGGGRFGQSLTAVAKLAPDANMGEGLAINYSGGSKMPGDVADWLKANGIE